MPEDIILDDVSPSIESVRRWGYDERLLFIEQDEDLILHELRYVPILLELARDRHCPKRDYALNIIHYYSQLTVLLQDRALARAIVGFADSVEREDDDGVRRWVTFFRRIFSQLTAPHTLDDDSAMELASDLLAGPYSSRSLERTGRVLSGFTEIRAYCGSYEAFLYVHLQRGIWRYSRHYPLEHIVA